jgi:hypothetical protein
MAMRWATRALNDKGNMCVDPESIGSDGIAIMVNTCLMRVAFAL